MFTLLIRPDGSWFITLCNQAAEGLGSVRGADATREFSAFRRENVLETVGEKFFERRKVRAIVQFWSVEQVGGLGALD